MQSKLLEVCSTDVLGVVASYILEASNLNGVEGFLVTSTLFRNAVLTNKYFWLWYVTSSAFNCNICFREAVLCSTFCCNNIHFWATTCRLFSAQKRVRRQWKTSFSSRLLVWTPASNFNSCYNERSFAEETGLHVFNARALSNDHITMSDFYSLLNEFLSLEMCTLEKSSVHSRSGRHSHGIRKDKSNRRGTWKQIKVIVIDSHSQGDQEQSGSLKQKPRVAFSSDQILPVELMSHTAPVTPDGGHLHDLEESQLLDSRPERSFSIKGRSSKTRRGDLSNSFSVATLQGVIDQQTILQRRQHRQSQRVNDRPSDQVRVVYAVQFSAVLVPSSLLSNYEAGWKSQTSPRTRRESDRLSTATHESHEEEAFTVGAEVSASLGWSTLQSSFRRFVFDPLLGLHRSYVDTRNYFTRRSQYLYQSSATRRVLGQQREMVSVLQDLMEAVGVSCRVLERGGGGYDEERHSGHATGGFFLHCDEQFSPEQLKETESVHWFVTPLHSAVWNELRMCLAVVRFIEVRGDEEKGKNDDAQFASSSSGCEKICCDQQLKGDCSTCNHCSLSNRPPASSGEFISSCDHSIRTGEIPCSSSSPGRRMARVAAIAFSRASPFLSSVSIPHPFDPFFALLDSQTPCEHVGGGGQGAAGQGQVLAEQ